MAIWNWRRLLWITLLLVVPVPIVIVGPGHVPPLRIIELGLITGSVMVVEQAGGAVPLLTVLMLFQGALYAGLLWLLVSAAVGLARRWNIAVGTPAAILIVLALVLASAVPLYRDPYQADSSRSTLLHVYE